MSDEWDFEAIDLPAGCWVHSKSGHVMLPGGEVIGELSTDGLRALCWFLEDLKRWRNTSTEPDEPPARSMKG